MRSVVDPFDRLSRPSLRCTPLSPADPTAVGRESPDITRPTSGRRADGRGEPDARTDAEPDALTDAQPDAFTGAEPDAFTGAEPDAFTDTEPDTDTDASQEPTDPGQLEEGHHRGRRRLQPAAQPRLRRKSGGSITSSRG